MLEQINIYGKNKVEMALQRLKTFEPEEGYYLAFSGGKDSVAVKALCDMANVKYDAHYNITTVDPPELVQFIKTFPDVSRDYARDENGEVVTMWNLIETMKIFPTRQVRYCCKYLKENHAAGRFLVTGVRHAESTKRKKRGGLELGDNENGARETIDPDNPSQGLTHICPTKAQRVLNPIIDWGNDDVWEFIHTYKIPYCKLYDEGFKRLGCIGCPMAGVKTREEQFSRFPKYKNNYVKAFERMIVKRRESGLATSWKTGEEVFDFWIRE